MAPQWGSEAEGALVGRELYPHDGDDGSDFDTFENENVVSANPEVATQLSAQLRSAFDATGAFD